MDSEPRRGVLAVEHSGKILFTKRIDISPGKLKEWVPDPIVVSYPDADIDWPVDCPCPWLETPINPGDLMLKDDDTQDSIALPDCVTPDDLHESVDAYAAAVDQGNPAGCQSAAAQGMIDSIRVFGQDLGAINPALGDLASQLLQAIRDIGPV